MVTLSWNIDAQLVVEICPMTTLSDHANYHQPRGSGLLEGVTTKIENAPEPPNPAAKGLQIYADRRNRKTVRRER